jgi:hypothetical protein
MGTMELKAYRCQKLGNAKKSKWLHKHEDPHSGRISERSKKAGWHHVAYVPSVKFCFPWSLLRSLILLFLALEMR